MMRTKSGMVAKRVFRGLGVVWLFIVGLTACEAPLDLDGVEAVRQQPIKRFDMYQDATASDDRVLLVSSSGAALVSDDQGASWTRYALDGSPSLISATACPDGDLYALDTLRQVWRLANGGTEWQRNPVETMEHTLSLSCAPSGTLWVTAGFASLYSSEDDGQSWTEFSFYDDIQITAVQFINETTGFAVGEFGLFARTEDGGQSWERTGDIPNEFYPMAAAFQDEQTGWVAGLDGVIWETRNGGQDWERQRSVNPSPIYRIVATEAGVYAAGGSATLIHYQDGKWESVTGAPHVPTYLRALTVVGGDTLLIAGGGGLVASVPTGVTSHSSAGDDA